METREEGRQERNLCIPSPSGWHLGLPCLLPPPVGLQAPAPPPARAHGVVSAAYSIVVFLAGHAEVLIIVSQEEKKQCMD